MNNNNRSSLRQNVEFQHTLNWGQNWRCTRMNIMKQWFPPIFAPSPNDCDPWPSRQLSPQSSSGINQTAITWWPTQTYWDSDCYCHHTQPNFDIQIWILLRYFEQPLLLYISNFLLKSVYQMRKSSILERKWCCPIFPLKPLSSWPLGISGWSYSMQCIQCVDEEKFDIAGEPLGRPTPYLPPMPLSSWPLGNYSQSKLS